MKHLVQVIARSRLIKKSCQEGLFGEISHCSMPTYIYSDLYPAIQPSSVAERLVLELTIYIDFLQFQIITRQQVIPEGSIDPNHPNHPRSSFPLAHHLIPVFAVAVKRRSVIQPKRRQLNARLSVKRQHFYPKIDPRMRLPLSSREQAMCISTQLQQITLGSQDLRSHTGWWSCGAVYPRALILRISGSHTGYMTRRRYKFYGAVGLPAPISRTHTGFLSWRRNSTAFQGSTRLI